LPYSKKRKGSASASSDNTGPEGQQKFHRCNGGRTDCNFALFLFRSKHL